MAYLMTFGPSLQVKHPIQETKTTVGTNLTNHLVIISPLISEFHCELIYQDHKYYLVDHSKHGTYVSNNRVAYGQHVELQHKDKVLLTNPQLKTQIGFNFYIDEHICKMCLQPLTNPVVVSCGHMFCESCVAPQERTELICPICGHEISEESEMEDESSCCSISDSMPYSTFLPTNRCKNCLIPWKGYSCTQQSQHGACASCGRVMPILYLDEVQNAQTKIFCQLCFTYHCKFYYEDCRDTSQIELTRNLGKFITLGHFNPVDQERILKQLKNRGLEQIFIDVSIIIEKGLFYFIHDRGYFQNTDIQFKKRILLDSPVCFKCHQNLLIQIIMMYIEFNKADSYFQVPNCKYGIFCPYQQDKYHIYLFNHICPQVAFD